MISGELIGVTCPTAELGPTSETSEPAGEERLVPLTVKAVLVLLGLAVFGLICFGIGTDHGSRHPSPVLTGRAYVSPYQGFVKVDGRSYGFEITANGMHWYDRSGGSHEGGIPPCMQRPGYTWIRFRYTDAQGPGGESWRVVTWVQCIDHP